MALWLLQNHLPLGAPVSEFEMRTVDLISEEMSLLALLATGDFLDLGILFHDFDVKLALSCGRGS